MYEIEYDDNTFLYGNLIEEDLSFSHEFGTEKQTGHYCDDLIVIYWHGDKKRDVTKLLTKHRPDLYTELLDFFLEKAIEKYT